MKNPKISEGEWQVMEVLWDRAPQTAAEVASAVRPETGWALNTVRTLLTRLVEKGVLRSGENASGIRQFSPAIERREAVRAESQSFLDRVFKGAAQPLLVHFATESGLTSEEVEELKRLLDQASQSNPKA